MKQSNNISWVGLSLGGVLLGTALLGDYAAARKTALLATDASHLQPKHGKQISRPEPRLPPDNFKPQAQRSPVASPVPVVEPFPSFNSQRLDHQIRLYAHYLATYGPPDVLIVGSSRALQGVDPLVLQNALAARGLHNVRVYNFSINGATARVVDLMVRRVLPATQLPRVLVWADGSRAFNSGRPDLTYNGIVASAGYRRMTQGNALAPENRPIPVFERPALAALEQERSLPSVNPGFTAPAVALPANLAALLPPLPVTDLTRNGFQSVATRYDPNTYYRRFPRVSGRNDSNYSPWRLTGSQTDATVAIANYARDRQIPLVFVSLPLTRSHLADSFRRRSEQQFRRYMQRLATQHRFVFRDLSQRWPNQSSYFADPSHLNSEGARAVANAIATDPNIPWRSWLSPVTPFPSR